MSKITNGFNSLDKLICEFTAARISATIEKRLCRNIQYREAAQALAGLKEELSATLSEEQMNLFNKYTDLGLETSFIREEFIYKRGMTDAFRIKDIILGS